MFEVKIELTGLLGIERGVGVIAHCVNAANPTLLNLPDDLRCDIPPHLPRLLIDGADEDPVTALPIQKEAKSCALIGSWTAINLLGWEVTFIGFTTPLNADGLDLLKMSDILAASGQTQGSLSLDWPKTAARVRIDRGTVTSGESCGMWRFSDAGGRAWELHKGVVIDSLANSPLYLHLRWLPDPRIVREIQLTHSGALHLRIENNVVATRDKDPCDGGYDFVSHYHLLVDGPIKCPYPYEETNPKGGGSNNVQCSPIQYVP